MCTTAEKPTERRRHNRLEAQHSVFAMVACDPITLREVTDVSLGGLRFCCFIDDKLPTDSFSLGLMTGGGMFVEAISATTIWSSSVLRNARKTFQRSRECGVRFDELTPEQVARLKTFIESHNTDKAQVQTF